MSGKSDGMGRAERAADPEWWAAACAAVVSVARSMRSLTTDDVLEAIDPSVSTHEMRALGPVMTAAARDGVIVKSRQMPRMCSRPTNHQRPLQVWSSLIFKGEDRGSETA
jgi:hypothetical protein